MIDAPFHSKVGLSIGNFRGKNRNFYIPASQDFEDGVVNFTVRAKDVTHLIPGFIAGAPYAIFPISKVLKQLNFYWKLLHFKKIGDNLWRYTFTIPGGATITMDASNGETNKG